MCESVIKEIKQDIRETFENIHIVAVVLSSNNLQHQTEWTPSSILNLYQNLTEFVENTRQRNIYLIYAVIIPSPSMNFPNHTVFFDSSEVFKYDGVIQAKFFEKDSIHMNRVSANLYAKCLANLIKNHF